MAEALFRRITVVTDGSEHAAHALDVAIDLARRYSSELTIFAVAPLITAFATPNEPFVPAAVPESQMPRFRELVEAAVDRARTAGITAVTGVAEEGVVVDEILEYVKGHPTDLLVAGSRGLSTTKRLLLGSVSTGLVTHAPCPVLVVRPSPKPPR